MQKKAYHQIVDSLAAHVRLVAVSKMQPVEAIQQLYNYGHRDFAENYVQELIEKQALLPDDISWHFIGHLQSNKIKYIVPFVHLIQSVDSVKLLMEIDRQAQKINRVVNCLLQVHIASEDTKYGLHEPELDELISGIGRANETNELQHVKILGLMGMGSFSDDQQKVRSEFRQLASLYDKYAAVHHGNIDFQFLSMGMSADYQMAVEEGSNMVRIGNLLFGARNKI